jgi:hypothetical protein
MGKIIDALREKRIDRLYNKKKEATMSGDMKKKEKADKKIATLRGRSLKGNDMESDYMQKGGTMYKKGVSVSKSKKATPKAKYGMSLTKMKKK